MGYDESNIRVLASSAEAIRRRPAMYLGPLDDARLFNRLIQESLCIAADEAMSGHCAEVRVEVRRDGGVTVRDNGRGIPMTPDEAGRPLAECLLTQLFACRESKENDRLAGACCQVGLVVVNAVSEWLAIQNLRDGACWSQAYRRGEPLGPFRREATTADSGVELTFLPDTTILGPLHFDGRALADWFAGLGLAFGAVEFGGGESPDGPTTLQFRGITPLSPNAA